MKLKSILAIRDKSSEKISKKFMNIEQIETNLKIKYKLITK